MATASSSRFKNVQKHCQNQDNHYEYDDDCIVKKIKNSQELTEVIEDNENFSSYPLLIVFCDSSTYCMLEYQISKYEGYVFFEFAIINVDDFDGDLSELDFKTFPVVLTYYRGELLFVTYANLDGIINVIENFE